MAGTWKIFLQIENTSSNVTWINVMESTTPKIQVEGIVKTAAEHTASKLRYFRDDDIGIYKTLSGSNSNDVVQYEAGTASARFKPLTEVLIQQFTTATGSMDGFTWNDQTSGNIQLRGKFTKQATSNIPSTRKMRMKIYILSAGLTLLDTVTTGNFDSGEAFEVKNLTTSGVDQYFDTGDKLVIEVYALFANGGG